MPSHDTHKHSTDPAERRSFFVKAAAVVFSGLVRVFPLIAGLGVVLHPLRRSKVKAAGDAAADSVGTPVRIGTLDILPADGIPRPFAVVADVSDAWTKDKAQRIGSVFLERTVVNGKPSVKAFSSVCPHLGCAVEFVGAQDRFECPCHASAFALDGKKIFGPSERGLDPLPVELKEHNGQTEIWVRYEKFRTGIAEREPIG